MLVLFDVDGTLTATCALDAELYALTFQAVFGAALPTADWSAYRSPTDRGIAEECVRRLRLDPRRLPELERRFVDALRDQLGKGGARPVPGAANVLERLAAVGHAAALATGAWERSARAKLTAAGIDLGEHVLVGSDFHPAREEIVREARRRSGVSTERTVYVGDGLWDVRTARALGLPFVGIDPERNGSLRRAAVRYVVEDYRDFSGFLSALRDASVP